jgi:hypothetical protein
MSCAQSERVIELLDHGEKDEVLLRHVTACADCTAELALLREGFGSLAAFEVAPPTQAVLERARQAGLAQTPQSSLVQLGAYGLASAAALLLLIGVQPMIAEQWSALTSVPILILAYAFGLKSAERGKLSAPFLGTTALGVALSMIASPRFGTSAEVCATFGAFVSVGPLAFSLFALRDGAQGGRVRTGAIAGAAAGLLGVAVERLHCPIGNLQHAFLGHFIILPLLIAAGALAGALALKPAEAKSR